MNKIKLFAVTFMTISGGCRTEKVLATDSGAAGRKIAMKFGGEMLSPRVHIKEIHSKR